jgi:hypothetical protein
MNDANGSTILQEVISNNHAGPMKSPVGAAQAPQPIAGRFGGAIDFVKFPGTGLTGAVVGNMSGSLPFIGQGDFSIVTWIKFPPTSASAPPSGPGGRHYIINQLRVCDPLGREVATLVDGEMGAGEHRVNFNAEWIHTGVYCA